MYMQLLNQAINSNKRLAWIILGIGGLFRSYEYFNNRSLWLDEAFIANTIINSPFLELFKQPLEYGHSVPPLFLILTKIPTILFGNTDIVLRFFPFICSIISLLLFYQVAKLYLSPRAVLVALALFAVTEPLIFYSVEVKQYGVDLLVTVFLLWELHYIQQNQLTFKKLILFAIIGSAVVWLSHPVIFLLATIGLYLTFFYFQQKQTQQIFYLFCVYAIWLVSFLCMYFFVMGGGLHKALPTSQWFFHFWQFHDAFIPHNNFLNGWEWFSQHYFGLFRFPGGFLKLNKLAGILFLVGCLYLLIMKNKRTLFLCTMPLILVFIANYFQQYPFPNNYLIASRVLLFLVPCLYLVIAEGIAQFLRNNYKIANISVHLVVTVCLTLILLARPTVETIQRLKTSFVIEDIKGVFNILKTQKQPYDKVYLYHWVDPMFRYYAPQYGFNYEECHLINAIPASPYLKEVDYFRRNAIVTAISSTHCILGVSELPHVSQIDLDMLRGQGRVWFVFAHTTDIEGFLRYLDQAGKRLYDFSTIGARIYLYEL